MQEVIKYFASIEERLNELEARVSELESDNAELTARLEEANACAATLAERVAQLEARPIAAPVVIETKAEEPAEPVQEKPKRTKKVTKAEEPMPAAEPTPAPEPQPEPKPEVVAPEPAPEKPAAPAPSQAQLYGKPVDDIRKAISVGDRFLFQRELFAQDPELMQKTLETLNQMPSFDEAKSWLDKQFGWDQESQAYELFMTVLHRRFI